jgi:hypothetical protein
MSRWSDEELRRALEAEFGCFLGPQVFQRLHARKKPRGASKKSFISYRVIAHRWDRFHSHHRKQYDDEKALAKRFLRHFRYLISCLDLRIGSYDALRRAVRIGKQEHIKARIRRKEEWQIMPTFSLVDAVQGRQRRLVTDAQRYRFLKAATERALLSTKQPGSPDL